MIPSRPSDLRLRTREVFFEALDQADAPTRARFLISACGTDLGLRRQVEQLLDDHFSEDAFMATPAGGQLPAVASEEMAGTRIGRYRLVRKLGEGGMGVVYLAEQEEPVRRHVALKIIKLGMDTRQVVARFEAERQALAMMDHPNIARVLDAGTTGDAGSQISNLKSQMPTGRPYFVMELVQGVPITEFCQKHQSTLEERLRLFISVCQAIQHAHQKGIIHRDLKPSNILVTFHDDKPTPKVIDFGVAKAINQRLTEKTLFTNVASMIGTPTYMSPEQAEGSGVDIDTRSDIYSLGVLLYELLTGSPPFPEKRLRSVPHREMQRILLEEEPERPSTRWRTTASPLVTRHSPLATDLDWIVMKCLEKERARRYDTASGLAADVERYLVHEPILARPPRTTDRMQKWIQRHKVQFASLITIATVLLLATAVSTWQAWRATRAQRAFQEQAEIAQLVKDFLLKQLVGSGDAWEDRSFDTNNRALIHRIAHEIEGQFTNQPLVEAEIRQALGTTMNWLDDFPQSLAQVEKAHAIRKLHLGPAHSDTLMSASEVGYNLYNLGRHREGDQVLDEAIAEARAASQIATHGAAEALFHRGWKLAFDGRPAEAMPYLREALISFRAALGEGSSRTSAGRFMVAVVTDQLGDREEARRLYEAGLNDCVRFLGANHTMTATFLKGYALFLIQEGRYEEAIEKLKSAIAIWKEAPAHGPDNLYTLESEGYLAVALEKQGEIAEAIRRNRDLHRRYAQHLRNYRSYRRVRDLAAFFVRHRLYADATAAYEDLKRALTEVPPQRASEFELLLQSTAATDGWEAAGNLCRAQLGAFPDSLSTWLQKAQVFRYLGDEENYRETVNQVLALPSTLVSTNEEHLPIEIAGLGPVKLSPGQLADLGAQIQSLGAALPDRNASLRHSGYRAMGQFLLRAGELERGLANLERAESDPSSSDAYTLYLKAICLKRLNQDEKASAALEKADSLAAAQNALEPGSENFLFPGQLYQLLVCRREAQAEIERR